MEHVAGAGGVDDLFMRHRQGGHAGDHAVLVAPQQAALAFGDRGDLDAARLQIGELSCGVSFNCVQKVSATTATSI